MMAAFYTILKIGKERDYILSVIVLTQFYEMMKKVKLSNDFRNNWIQFQFWFYENGPVT